MNDCFRAFANVDPNCKLSNSSIAPDSASLTKRFAIRRRNTSPTAIGRTPPFFLDKDVNEAQQSALEIKAGKSPLLLMFITLSLPGQTWTDQVQCSLLRAEDVLETS